MQARLKLRYCLFRAYYMHDGGGLRRLGGSPHSREVPVRSQPQPAEVRAHGRGVG